MWVLLVVRYVSAPAPPPFPSPPPSHPRRPDRSRRFCGCRRPHRGVGLDRDARERVALRLGLTEQKAANHGKHDENRGPDAAPRTGCADGSATCPPEHALPPKILRYSLGKVTTGNTGYCQNERRGP